VTQFRERNPIPIAVIGLAVLVLLGLVAFNAGNIGFLGGGGTTYHADFQEASNVRAGDDVRLAGIKVGEVTSVELDGAHVRIAMKLHRGTRLGTQTRADIKIKTLLGAMYVALDSQGTGRLDAKTDIPLSRTSTPLIVTTAFGQLAKQVDAIDTTQLAAAFETLSADFADTPGTVRKTLDGLAAVSRTVSSRDAELRALLAHAQGVTGALASRDQQVTRLIADGQTVLQLVDEQRDVIHALLVHTTELSQQISALVAENRTALKPALVNLGATVDILTKNQQQLDDGIHLLAPFVREFTNTLGSGQYFDTQVANLTDLTKLGCFTIAVKATPTSAPLTLPLQGASGECL